AVSGRCSWNSMPLRAGRFRKGRPQHCLVVAIFEQLFAHSISEQSHRRLQMRYLGLLFCLLVAYPLDASAEDATERYQALAAAARRGDQPIDWQALRFAYAATPQFDVLGASTKQKRSKMFQAYANHDYAGALAEAKQILDEDYVDIAAHMTSDFAY